MHRAAYGGMHICMCIARPGAVQVSVSYIHICAVQVSALFSAEALRLRPGPFHVLLYAPEEDAACLLRCGGGGDGEDDRLRHCWSMPWADFHWRCAPDQPPPSAADAPPQRHAGLGMQGQGGLASLVPSLPPAQRPSLPDGAPRISKALLQDLVRRREASRASSHLVTPVVPPPPRDAPPTEARAATEQALRSLRLVCAQLVAVLDSSSVQLGPPLGSVSPPPPLHSDEEEIARIMRRSKAEAMRLKKQGLPLEGTGEARFFYGTAPDVSVSVPNLPFLKTVRPQKTTLGIDISFMRRRGLIPFNAIPTTS